MAAPHRLERPAFYALRPGGWRDLITLLHPPYTAWHLSYVAFGAAAAPELHAGLAANLVEARVDTVFLAGPLMRALHDALPAVLRGGYAETAADLEPMVAGGIERGDVIMVKGSNASRMWRLVDSLKAKFAVEADSDVTQDVA